MACKHPVMLGVVLFTILALIETTTARGIFENKLKNQNQLDKQRFKFKDCRDLWKAGYKKPDTYAVYMDGFNKSQIFCNNTERVHAQSVVVQRRLYGTESFHRNYNDYVVGFGHPQGDYWAGLGIIHHYTSNLGYKKLRIDMQDWAGNKRYITYSTFVVTAPTDYYRLLVRGPYGTLVDDLSFNDNMYFFTPDRTDQHNCAVNQKAGWWYNYCTYALLNGHYYQNGHYTPPAGGYYDGIYWKDWGGYAYSMKFVSMTLYQ